MYQGDPSLPPPGDARREVLAERTDDLAERAEGMADQVDLHSVNPAALKKDREIQHLISHDALTVSNANHDMYRYKWVTDKYPTNSPGIAVMRELARKVIINGTAHVCWEMVRGDMPESRELKTAEGTRRVGDCILMRCRVDMYMFIEKEQRERQQRQQNGVDSHLIELGEKANRMGGGTTRSFQKAHAAELAQNQFTSMLKDGSIPGHEMR